MEETRSGMPYLLMAATVSPPPAMENAFDSAIAWASVRVQPPNWSNSNTPTGPFQTMVPARFTMAASASGLVLRGGARREFLGADHIDGQRDVPALGADRCDDLFRLTHQFRLSE